MAKLSRREEWAAKTGKDKKEYKNSPEGRAAKKIKKDYKQKSEFLDEQSDLNEDKLKKDFEFIIEEAGYKRDDIMEDFTRNIGRLAENKTTDLDDLNYYLDTNRGRTQEDLDTSLKTELRSFNLTMDREEESLASRNLGLSGMSGVRGKEERDIDEEHKAQNEAFMRTAKRSFQDLARLESVKNASIQRQYGRDVEDTTSAKDQGIRDIDFGAKKAESNYGFASDQLDLDKDVSEYNLKTGRAGSLLTNTMNFDAQRNRESYETPLWNNLMS